MEESNKLKNRLDSLFNKHQGGDIIQLFDALIEEFSDELNHSIELAALLGVIEEFYSDKILLDTLMDFIESGTGNDNAKRIANKI